MPPVEVANVIPDVPFSSNAMRLSGRQWAAAAALAVAVAWLAPVGWMLVEKFTPGPDYRLPYGQGSDYWAFERWCAAAAGRCDTVVIGDSFVWGQYVEGDQTLSHCLNALAGTERFANLGLDGMHPAALAGLLEYHGRAIRGRNVVLHLNPLWMSSAKHDLTEEEESRFNHPELVPQFFPRIPVYRENISRRIGIAVERYLPFIGWTRHIQAVYFDGMDIPAWTLDHPYALAPAVAGPAAVETVSGRSPVSWTARGLEKQDLPWVGLDTSLQWRFFRRAVGILQGRGNHVFVLVGPFNEHMLEPGSRRAYAGIRGGMERWLRETGTDYCAPPALPSALYADASHPLAPGYAAIAKQVFAKLAPVKVKQ
jgi:hypothetical protein